MSQAIPFSDLSSDPRNDPDRVGLRQPLDYPGSTTSFMESNMNTIVASVAAATIALLLGLWLAGRGQTKKAPPVLPRVNRAELAFEFAPIAAKLLQSPAIRAYIMKLALRSVTRKFTG